MNTQEKYEDREITVRGRETCLLSQLTKEERDIYFAGYEDGESSDKDSDNNVFTYFFIGAVGCVWGMLLTKIFGS